MRKWRWFRVVLLVALAALLAAAGAFFWSSWRRAREFDEFQQRVAGWGGFVAPSLNYKSPLLRYRNVSPPLLDPLIGSDAYHVSTRSRDLTKRQLDELLSISPIRSLAIAATPQLSDDHILAIRDPAAMMGLHLNDVAVSDRSVEVLAKMDGLTDLSLVGTQVSDNTVERLLRFPKLNGVYVGGPNIRAVRLVEAEVVDETGRPATVAEPTLHVRGRVALEPRFGKPGNVRVMVRPEGDPPPWQCQPYGWNASRGEAGMLVEQSPGTWMFDVPVARIPGGASSVEIWVDQSPAARRFVHYRLPPFPITLTWPVEPRGGVAGPAPVR